MSKIYWSQSNTVSHYSTRYVLNIWRWNMPDRDFFQVEIPTVDRAQYKIQIIASERGNHDLRSVTLWFKWIFLDKTAKNEEICHHIEQEQHWQQYHKLRIRDHSSFSTEMPRHLKFLCPCGRSVGLMHTTTWNLEPSLMSSDTQSKSYQQRKLGGLPLPLPEVWSMRSKCSQIVPYTPRRIASTHSRSHCEWSMDWFYPVRWEGMCRTIPASVARNPICKHLHLWSYLSEIIKDFSSHNRLQTNKPRNQPAD